MIDSMSIFEKVDNLRIKKGLSSNKLCTKAGISHGTLNAWKTRQTMPTLDVLEWICDALEIHLATLLFDIDTDDLTGEEIDLLSAFRKLSEEQKHAAVQMIKAMQK